MARQYRALQSRASAVVEPTKEGPRCLSEQTAGYGRGERTLEGRAMVTKAARKINQTAGSEARRRRQTSADRQQLATERREGLLAAGYWPIPVNGKIPMLDDWTDVRATRDMIERWARNYPNTNTSILTFNAPAIDIDVLDRDVADEIEQVAANILGPNTAVRTGMAPKRAILFRTDE